MAHQIISDSRASGFYLSKRGSGALPGLRSIRLSFQDGEGRIRRESDRRFDVQRSVDAPHHIPLRPRFLGRDSFRGTVGGGKTNDGSSDPPFVIPRPCIARWRKVRKPNLSSNTLHINTLNSAFNRNTPNRPQHVCSYFPLNSLGYHKLTNILLNLQLKQAILFSVTIDFHFFTFKIT